MLQFLFGLAIGAGGYWAWQSFGRDLLGMGGDQGVSYGGVTSGSYGDSTGTTYGGGTTTTGGTHGPSETGSTRGGSSRRERESTSGSAANSGTSE
jgi:hypothetical protein